MKKKALRTGDAHSHEDEECRKRSTLCFGRCLTSATGAQQRARRENVPRHILSYSLGEDSGWSLFLMKRSFTEQNGIPVRGLSGYTPDSVCRPRSYHEAG